MTASAPAARRVISDPREIPLIVISFDKYEDLWGPFFAFFWKNWPDCPFKVHLGTNYKTYADPRVTTIQTGDEVTWATRLRRLVEAVNTEYVLIVLEDFLVTAPVDTSEMLRLARVAIDERVGVLRFAPNPAPSEPVPGHPDLGRILPTDPYRITSQIAIWHSETLLSFLDPAFSIWEFEFHSSIHGKEPARPMWARWKPALQYQHCVQRGKWLPWGIATCRAAGVPIDLTARGRMRGLALWRHRYEMARGKIFWLLPAAMRRKRWAEIVARESSARANIASPATAPSRA